MRTLACKDLGTPECDFTAKGETAGEVVEEMFSHAEDAHKDKIEAMEGEKNMTVDQIKEMMATKVKEEEGEDM